MQHAGQGCWVLGPHYGFCIPLGSGDEVSFDRSFMSFRCQPLWCEICLNLTLSCIRLELPIFSVSLVCCSFMAAVCPAAGETEKEMTKAA